ncbi:YgaP family membrane protein [Methylobacter sp.]|uniref:YgaP family membrane protein n=1 Tax=Methylobacter sp. TaxID=2051955 RepID=UPI002FDE6550
MTFDFKRMLKFEHNVGEKEKKYRLYGGAALLVISLFIPGGEVLLLLVGLVLVATGYSGWCPVYSGLNKNTCEAVNDSTEADSTESDSTES